MIDFKFIGILILYLMLAYILYLLLIFTGTITIIEKEKKEEEHQPIKKKESISLFGRELEKELSEIRQKFSSMERLAVDDNQLKQMKLKENKAVRDAIEKYSDVI